MTSWSPTTTTITSAAWNGSSNLPAPGVCGPAHERIPCRDLALDEGDQVTVLGVTFQVLAVPGHTLGHIALFSDQPATPVLFSGDTLFAAGCGRMFEGTPEQMQPALARLAALPEQTEVYCAHEYTLSNLRFAKAVEPDNPHVQQRFEDVTRLRAENRITLPSTIGLERLTNPFLRTSETLVKQKADEWKGHSNPSHVAVFCCLEVLEGHLLITSRYIASDGQRLTRPGAVSRIAEIFRPETCVSRCLHVAAEPLIPSP
ncbi:hydroxyacylglutathione hydrolase [Pseudomonas putida S11]|nr:hydroxyacylglutathione hydrolase [Pseudomonas putida S11]